MTRKCRGAKRDRESFSHEDIGQESLIFKVRPARREHEKLRLVAHHPLTADIGTPWIKWSRSLA